MYLQLMNIVSEVFVEDGRSAFLVRRPNPHMGEHFVFYSMWARSALQVYSLCVALHVSKPSQRLPPSVFPSLTPGMAFCSRWYFLVKLDEVYSDPCLLTQVSHLECPGKAQVCLVSVLHMFEPVS